MNFDYSIFFVTGVRFAFYYVFILFLTAFCFYFIEIHLLFFLKKKLQNKGSLLRQKLTVKAFAWIENVICWFAPRQYEKMFLPGFFKITSFKTLCFFMTLTYLYPNWHYFVINQYSDFLSSKILLQSAKEIYAFLEMHLKTIGLTLGTLGSLALIFSGFLYKFKTKNLAKREIEKNRYGKAFDAHRKVNKNLRVVEYNFEKNIQTFHKQTESISQFVEQLRRERQSFNVLFVPSSFERLCGEYKSSSVEFDNLLEIGRQIDEDCIDDEFFELSKKFRRELFYLSLDRIEKKEIIESKFLDQAYIRNLFKSWKENIIENCFDDSQVEYDIKWRVDHILSEALEQKLLLERLLKKQQKQNSDSLLRRIVAALPA